jgi:hypothetical protein
VSDILTLEDEGSMLLRNVGNQLPSDTTLKLKNVIFIDLLTPWSRVFLEKLTGSQLVKKLPAFYGTRKFITAFTSARYLTLF